MGAIERNQETLAWEPALAQSYTLSPDEMTVTIDLRSGLRWSDGVPLTAGDFVFAHEVYTTDGIETNVNVSAGEEQTIWTETDSDTFTITSPTVYAGLFEICSAPPLP